MGQGTSSENNYEQVEKLEQGTFGVVNLVKRKSDEKLFAMKVLELGALKPEDIFFTKIEAQKLLGSLYHVNIIEMEELFVTKSN